MPKLSPGPALQHANGNALPIMAMTPAGLEPAIPGSVGRCLIHWARGPAEKGSFAKMRSHIWKLLDSGKQIAAPRNAFSLASGRSCAIVLVSLCVCVCVCVASP